MAKIDQSTEERSRRSKLFGSFFPNDPFDRSAKKAGSAWRKWIDARLHEQSSVMRDKRLHWARHRHFRQGRQWISTRDGRTWRELSADKNTVRLVLNIVGPALDFRLALLEEQRPGFKTHPLGTGIAGRETAEAQQNIAEFYYNKGNAGQKLLRDAAYNAQTDGVSFIHVFVNKEAGPLKRRSLTVDPDDDRFDALREQGFEVNDDGQIEIAVDETGKPQPPGTEVMEFHAGEIDSRIVLANELFADPEAKTMNGPFDAAKWVILRRTRDLRSARLETGDEKLESDEAVGLLSDPILDSGDAHGRITGYQRGLPPFPATRMRREQGVFDFIVYIRPNPSAGLPKGLWRRVIGNRLVAGGDELPGGLLPFARVPDGSPDTDLFPRPVMSDWIPDQMVVNSIISKLIEHLRAYGTGRTFSQAGTILKETYTEITGSVVEWRGTKPEFQPGIRVSGDVWTMLQFIIKKLEDKSGFTDLARGMVSGTQGGGFQDVTGRSVLAARELFERQFAPMIHAAALGMTEWARLIVTYARWLFDEPRLIPRAGRPDLAKRISGHQLGDEDVVYVDPETLVPLPKALRNQLLIDLLKQGLITAEEYRRRAPFSEIRNVEMGDTLQWERAQLINTILEERWQELEAMGLPQRYLPEAGGVGVYWQDDPAVAKRALIELIADEKQEVGLRDLAAERWAVYDDLQRAQFGQAPSPPFVRGVPFSLGGQPAGAVQQTQPALNQPPGAGAQPETAPAPTLSSVGLPAASQDIAEPLGTRGQVELVAESQQQ